MIDDEHPQAIDELATVFDEKQAAHDVLDRIDFPISRRPVFDPDPRSFWRRVYRAVQKGLTDGGTKALVQQALLLFPDNPVFKRLAVAEDPSIPRPQVWNVPREPENLRAVFTYGSLLSEKSLRRSILRPSEADIRYIPARLKGYKLTWRALTSHLNMVSADWDTLPEAALEALILERGEHSDWVEGALIVVNSKELRRLELREKNYSLEPISSEKIEIPTMPAWLEDVKIVVFSPKEAKGREEPKNTAVREGYYELVSSSYEALGLDVSRLPKPKQIRKLYDADHLAEMPWRKNQQKTIELSNRMKVFLRKENALHILNEGNETIPTAIRPIVVNRSLYQAIKRSSEAVVSLCSKAVELTLHKSGLMKEMGYDEEMIDLTKCDCASSYRIPDIARVDMTFDRDALKIFELNSDSPGGMFHFDKVKAKQIEFCKELEMDRLDYAEVDKNACSAVGRALLDRWSDFCRHDQARTREEEFKEDRLIAIVERDWEKAPTRTEYEYFKMILKNNGVDTAICDPAELDFRQDDGRLWLGNRVVDQVYKRALLADLRAAAKVTPRRSPLFEAYEANAVSVVNSFRSRLAGNKLLLALISDDRFEDVIREIGSGLTDAEREVKARYLLRSRTWGKREFKDVNEIATTLEHCKDYVLKSFDGFGSDEVFDGATTPQAKKKFEEMFDQPYIIQERHPHGVVQIPCVEGGQVSWKPMFFIMGAYVINGKCVGVEAKVAHNTPVTLRRDRDENPRGYRTAVIPTAT